MTTYKIKAENGYYSNTYNAPKDGYLMDAPSYDGFTGRETCEPLEFESIGDAWEFLTNRDEWNQNAMCCEYDGDGKFSVGGQYVTSHGQHSRPRYTIVSAKSGRCNKEIIAECDKLAAEEA